jgi:hypothetical protein
MIATGFLFCLGVVLCLLALRYWRAVLLLAFMALVLLLMLISYVQHQ